MRGALIEDLHQPRLVLGVHCVHQGGTAAGGFPAEELAPAGVDVEEPAGVIHHEQQLVAVVAIRLFSVSGRHGLRRHCCNGFVTSWIPPSIDTVN
jgi:hypothetical protein